MTQRINGIIDTEKVSKIIGIQFSILSPEEIRKSSVAEITSRDTYINNKPVINGLFDPRMGVIEPGFICPTDGLNYMQTPGYFGHIELARPLFYIQYLKEILKILRCICIKCSKLLIDKTKYNNLLKLDSYKRWNFIFQNSNKIKRCGEETSYGCGCIQPKKIKKEGLATIIATWEDENDIVLNLTPEQVLKIFRRISDEDITFLGFSPLWSRPEWMICQVLALPPPAVRPSVKHDAQQRSEDDLSHIIVNIIKANNALREKMNTNTDVVDDWTTLLQYYVSTLVDNKIPGVAAHAQRSGRPLKSIKERLNGKGGRVRGNLMGKRVDYSARSVITPDANLSISELGVPLKIAKNLTKPLYVNHRNIKFVKKLVENGPKIYPGANLLKRKNGDEISLEYVDRNSLKLEIGDIVHRHMLDGDAILFNRQPTLHRMSMMCHIVKVLKVGDTFRMNVGDTKPYNADFDGDEMNLHMPQDLESETELRVLAAVPYQIISPANNKSIVGIFQDSLLGSYRITRNNINFTHRQYMNLLMDINNVDLSKIPNKKLISSFDLISQILPPLSIKYKTKRFKNDEDFKTSNNVLEIINGNYIRGQMEKGVLGDGSKGLLQRICNNFGNMRSANFIDDIQNIVTEYMKTSSYSVGISDLIADNNTNDLISEVITNKKKDVNSLIQETHLGVFENKTANTNEEEFETKINNILNRASQEAGKIGRESLSKDNRFVIMVNAGSKGSEINISQMISCLGQQNVDGKRIPYGFENRTLPHFSKYDDSPSARGFVENSFISGLSPQELFFHAIGGRVGLIDTAVKTSQTGYIQRRLIKGLEDIKVEYDMTVRNNKNKIIQFSYGDDNFDTTKVENQQIPIIKQTINDIYNHFHIPFKNENVFTSETNKRMKKQIKDLNNKSKSITDFMVNIRNDIVKNVMNDLDNKTFHLPVSFKYIIDNVQGQNYINSQSIVDITPLEAYEIIDNGYERLNNLYYTKPNELFKIFYYYNLSPTNLLLIKKFNKKALEMLIENIILLYKKAIVAPGEMVGMIAAQSIGEPTTQMTLNTFHFAGVASKSNVTRGVPRIEEILSLSENPKNPSCTIYLNKTEELDKKNAQKYMHHIEYTKLRSLVDVISICFDPKTDETLINDDNNLINRFNEFENMINECNIDPDTNDETKTDKKVNDNKSKWIIRIELNIDELLDRNITMDDINFTIKNVYKDDVDCVFSDYNDDNLVFRIRLNQLNKKYKKNVNLDQQDDIYLLKKFQDDLLDNLIIRGINGIKSVSPRKIVNSLLLEDNVYLTKETWVIDTVGTNLLDILSLDYIDTERTFTNDIREIHKILGIEAARQSIYNEISDVIEFDNTYINSHHIALLCDRMTCNSNMVSIFRHGINNDDIGPIAKASFEETPEMFLRAARHGELDELRGVSSNVMCGQEGYFGTSAFNVVLDLDRLTLIEESQSYSAPGDIMGDFEDLDVNNDPCSLPNIEISSNVDNIKTTDMGMIDDYEMDF